MSEGKNQPIFFNIQGDLINITRCDSIEINEDDYLQPALVITMPQKTHTYLFKSAEEAKEALKRIEESIVESGSTMRMIN